MVFPRDDEESFGPGKEFFMSCHADKFQNALCPSWNEKKVRFEISLPKRIDDHMLENVLKLTRLNDSIRSPNDSCFKFSGLALPTTNPPLIISRSFQKSWSKNSDKNLVKSCPSLSAQGPVGTDTPRAGGPSCDVARHWHVLVSRDTAGPLLSTS